MLTKNEEEKLNEFFEILLSIKTKDKLANLLFGILTEKELKEIPMRLQIVRQLKKGVPHQNIAERLGVGVATVTRGSKEIQKGRFKYV